MTMATNWLITGAGGQFGSVLLAQLVSAGYDARGWVSPRGPKPRAGRCEAVDLCDAASGLALLDSTRPRVIVHAAAVTSVQAAYDDPGAARRTNVDATKRLAEWAAGHDARLIYISTDMVFDGSAAPYDESAATCPVSRYGRSKADAEEAVRAIGGDALIVRLPLLYGLPAVDRPTTFVSQLAALREGRALRLFTDEFRTPIELGDAARAVIEAAASTATGVLHVAGPQRLSRYEMIEIAARALAIERPNLTPISRTEAGGPEPRPADLSLLCRRFELLFGRAPGRPMAETMRQIVKSE